MPNFLYDEPIRRFAAHLAVRQLGGIVAKHALERIVRVVAAELKRDARNAIPARSEDITEALPDWAQTALTRGEELHLFKPCPLAAARIKRTLKSLRDAALDLRSHDANDHALVLGSRKLLENLDHLTFADIERKAKAQSRMRARLSRRRAEAAIRTLDLCEAETLEVSGGRRWRRIRSVAELAETGTRMRNCTSPDRAQSRHYYDELTDGTAEFWVLETSDGAPIIELMASTMDKTIVECQGVGNRAVETDAPEIAALLRAKGFSFRRIAPRSSAARQLVEIRAAALRRDLDALLNPG